MGSARTLKNMLDLDTFFLWVQVFARVRAWCAGLGVQIEGVRG